MLSKKERVSRLTFQKRPVRTGRFIYGSIKGFEGNPSGAVVVSKKICKTAPERNRVRRRVYNILRDFIRKGLLSGVVIVYPNKAATTADFQHLKQELAKCLGITV